MLGRWHTRISSLGLYLWDSIYNMTTKLAPLSSITRLSPRVLRILGQNPGQMTLQGTNCYLVHSPDYHTATGSLRLCLIDTGSAWPTSSSFLPLLRKGISSLRNRETKADAGDPVTSITDIVLTHRHPDHVGGLQSILAVFTASGIPLPRVHKFPHPVEDQTSGERVDWDQLLIKDAWPSSETVTTLSWLHDGQRIALQQDLGAIGTTLRVVHTPGHTEDSISLVIEETDEIFTADTILGQGTSVFADLSAYMASLHKILALKPNTIYPGHGPHIEGQTSSIAKIEEYINHRNEREQQILSVLREKTNVHASSAAALTTREIVEVLYAGLGVGVFIAATKPVVAHLQKLEDDGKVVRDPDGRWRLL